MNYINAEQFQEQPKEVQEVLLDWWKPSTGDLVLITEFPIIEQEPLIYALKDDEDYIKTETPLFTEGQLREFIEEKTEGKVIFDYIETIGGYSIGTVNKKSPTYESNWYENLGDNLLQAYWKVACQIAEEVAESKYFSLKITYRELCILKHALRDKVEQKEKTGDYDFYIRMLKENENSITDRGKKELKEYQEEKEALDSITKCVEEVQAYIGKQEDV